MQLRDGISKKHKDIKNEFTKYCRIKAHAFLDQDICTIKRNL